MLYFEQIAEIIILVDFLLSTNTYKFIYSLYAGKNILYRNKFVMKN